ncbi:substrate-binding domain-containing protein [Leeuwenhoekiella sp. W20_SRS_FM14]|uniref:substrate-binding domain-containing protein n=1 Tax=Leeuwenhoekiella sp. W20_SRS_FM14 TaxID=3240270 RepID=UPI003F97AD51
MKENYTIKDIAELAGVSKGTVDRVIHKRGKVSPKALEQVNKVLDKIEYKPNPIAKSLKNNKIYNIAILLPDADADPYWLPCYEAIKQVEQEFSHFGIKINKGVFKPKSTKSFTKAADLVIAEKPDAVLMVPLFYKEAEHVAKMCVAAGIKIATFNNYIKEPQINLEIGQDLFQSGRVAAKLFNMLLGNKATLAVLHIDEAFQNASHMQEKERGFKDYFAQKELAFTINVHNIKKESKIPFDQTIENFLKSIDDVDGLFVTTSKAYLLANHIAAYLPKSLIIGYDLVAENIKYLEEDKIAFLIHQDPKKQVYLSLTNLIEFFLFDKPLQESLTLPIDIINTENYPQYLN